MRELSVKNVLQLIHVASVLIIFFLAQVSYPQQDISEYQDRLGKLAEQIKELKAKIKKEEEKQSTILSRLDRIGFNKKLIRKEISLYNVQLDKANGELSSTKKSIPQLRAKLEKERESIEKILITLYKFGKFSFLQLMLHAENVGTLISESKNLALLAQYQEKIVSDYLESLNQLQSAEAKLVTKKKEISLLIKNANQKRQELTAQEGKYEALIREVEKSKKSYLRTLDELKERAEQLQILIKKLLKEEISLPFPLVPLYEKKGELPWPIEGKIITLFGLQRHPRFNTITINNGIEISPANNDMVVKSIHQGKVVYTDYFQGYGNLIIIDHGMTYYSLYGHCSDFLVKKGESVKAGQAIAIIGDFSSLEGISLYFEIRFKTKPLHPLKWLKRR